MQRSSTAWVLLGYLLVVVISLLIIDLRVAFFATAVAICAFVMLGFLVFPVATSPFVFRLNAVDENKLAEASQGFRFLGKTLHPRWFSQEIRCAMRLRNMPLLAVALLGAVMVIVALQRKVSLSFLFTGEHRMYMVAVLTLAGGFLLIWSWTWLADQIFLRKSVAAFGLVQSYIDENQSRAVRYEFHDLHGERRGSIEQDVSEKEEDHAVVVLYQASNPDNCRSSRGFLFRKFVALDGSDNN
jgi:hypothetical protein